MHTYTVRHGDSLYSIAQKFDIRADALARFNSLANADNLYIGQVIMIPVRLVTYRLKRGEDSGSALRLMQAANDDMIIPPDNSNGTCTFYFEK